MNMTIEMPFSTETDLPGEGDILVLELDLIEHTSPTFEEELKVKPNLN